MPFSTTQNGWLQAFPVDLHVAKLQHYTFSRQLSSAGFSHTHHMQLLVSETNALVVDLIFSCPLLQWVVIVDKSSLPPLPLPVNIFAGMLIDATWLLTSTHSLLIYVTLFFIVWVYSHVNSPQLKPYNPEFQFTGWSMLHLTLSSWRSQTFPHQITRFQVMAVSLWDSNGLETAIQRFATWHFAVVGDLMQFSSKPPD